jgi:hypothetical protein
MDHSWAPTGMGLHRSDPARRVVGIPCRGVCSKVRRDDDYMIVINAADMCAYTSGKARTTTRIPWWKWERSTTVIKIALSVTKAIAISGCRFFAMTRGFSWTFVELLRIYDLSPGTRGGRYPNRPPVRDIMLNLGRGATDEGKKVWGFSEDNLLLFHVSLRPFVVRRSLVLDH